MKQLFAAEFRLLKVSKWYVLAAVLSLLMYFISSVLSGFFAPPYSRYSIVLYWVFSFLVIWLCFYWPEENIKKGEKIRMAATKYERLRVLTETKRVFFVSRVLLLCVFFVVSAVLVAFSQLPYLIQSIEAYQTELLSCGAIVFSSLLSFSIIILLTFERSGFFYVLTSGGFGGVCGVMFSQLGKDDFRPRTKYLAIVLFILFVMTVLIRYVRILAEERRS